MADARQALPVFKQKLDQLASQRGQIGAFEARLSTAVSTTRVASENYATAASQISDADVATEAAKLVRNQILQQAGAAILAQANQAPALALVLLG
jgi:flagellin